ncbi:hypothetical protein [uncultured Mucilaginibacter sp.]|uniref:hypothetical protein n=1 Tax=uncultured Mucilaginibacter sp. TaxID=797541 RepID=UPI00262316C9|nr:hypothetical protein [uncultured Mucilaginibacter sp.]
MNILYPASAGLAINEISMQVSLTKLLQTKLDPVSCTLFPNVSIQKVGNLFSVSNGSAPALSIINVKGPLAIHVFVQGWSWAKASQLIK